MSPVRWVTAFLDSPAESAEVSETFWSRVTGTLVSPRRGARDEFATLVPPDGDAYLKTQRVEQSVPGALHLDLHTDDVSALSLRAQELGATTSHLELGYVVCGSPGGLTFCIVDHPGGRRPSAPVWPGGRSAVDQVCLDIPPGAYDVELAFWAALTGWAYHDVPACAEFERLRRPAGMALAFLLQRLDDEQPTVTAHLDLSSDDRDAEVARHRALGADPVRRTSAWTVLRDPAARAYCVTDRAPGAP